MTLRLRLGKLLKKEWITILGDELLDTPVGEAEALIQQLLPQLDNNSDDIAELISQKYRRNSPQQPQGSFFDSWRTLSEELKRNKYLLTDDQIGVCLPTWSLPVFKKEGEFYEILHKVLADRRKLAILTVLLKELQKAVV